MTASRARLARTYREHGWWRDETLADDIARHAAAHAGRARVHHRDRAVSWRQYARRSDQLAGVLVAAGYPARASG